MNRHANRGCGITRIGMLALLLLLGGLCLGTIWGIAQGAGHCVPDRIAVGVLGALVGLILALLVLAEMYIARPVFTILYHGAAGLLRLLQPTSCVCTCSGPRQLNLAATDAEIASSTKLREVEGIASVEAALNAGVAGLRARLDEGDMDFARLSLAASLGHPLAIALSPPPPAHPLFRYDPLAAHPWTLSDDLRSGLRAAPILPGFPSELSRALQSGLPPRLIVAWTLACAERALVAFETEFHEERRARQAFGAAVLALLDTSTPPESLAASLRGRPWWKWNEGCRVVRRTAWQRFGGAWTPGECAAFSIACALECLANVLEPRVLWTTGVPRGEREVCDSSEHRVLWARPCFLAHLAARDAALVAGNPHDQFSTVDAARASDRQRAEFAWQSRQLADLILGWSRWDEDRDSWQHRVDAEWIPRIYRELRGTRFPLAPYVECVRRELVPWRGQIEDSDRAGGCAHGRLR